MAPSPLTPISEESLPNFAEIKIQREKTSSQDPAAPKKTTEDRGCLFFYESPEVKGPFFDDEFFKSSQKSYDEAMQSMLERSNGSTSSMPGTSNMTSYRSMRLQDNKQDTRASGLTENKDNFQIAMDVHSYAPSEITVKAVGDQELLLEGQHVEHNTTGGTNLSRSFSRRFCLPGLVKLDAVTSALSSDGVLTVTAPKVSQQKGTTAANNNKKEFIEPLPSSTNGIQSSIFNERENLYNEELGHLLNDISLDSKMKYEHGNNIYRTPLSSENKMNSSTTDMVEEDLHYKISLDTTGYGPKDVSVKAVGDRELQIEGRHVEKNSAGAETSKNFSRRFCLPGAVKLEAITSSLSPQGILTITAPKIIEETTSASSLQNERVQDQQTAPRRDSLSGSNSTQFTRVSSNSDNNSDFYGGNHLDDFFTKDFDMSSNINYMNQNSFMEKARNDYKESLENMMNRNWILESSAPQFFSEPASHRLMENTSTQSSSSDIIESANDYKMQLDVSKYRPEDISVKAVGEQELLIEGHHKEQPSGGPSISHSFSRRFSLPGLVKLDAVTSSLAPGGVLTVTAPKLAVTQ